MREFYHRNKKQKFVSVSYALSQSFFWSFIITATFITLLRLRILAFVNSKRVTISTLLHATIKMLASSPIGIMILALTGTLFITKENSINNPQTITKAHQKQFFATLFSILCSTIAVATITQICNHLFPPIAEQTNHTKKAQWIPHLLAYIAALATFKFLQLGVLITLFDIAYKSFPTPFIKVNWKFCLSKVETTILILLAFVLTFTNAHFQAPSLKKTWKRMSYGILILKLVITVACLSLHIVGFRTAFNITIGDETPQISVSLTKLQPIGFLCMALFSLWYTQGILCYLDRFVNHITGSIKLVSWAVWITVSTIALLWEVIFYNDVIKHYYRYTEEELPTIPIPMEVKEGDGYLLVIISPLLYFLFSLVDLFRWFMQWEADEEIQNASHRSLSASRNTPRITIGNRPPSQESINNPNIRDIAKELTIIDTIVDSDFNSLAHTDPAKGNRERALPADGRIEKPPSHKKNFLRLVLTFLLIALGLTLKKLGEKEEKAHIK